MVALQIRNVPDDVRDALAEQAADRGQSLQAYLLAMVEDRARRPGNAAILRRISARGGGSYLTPEEAVRLVDEARAEWDARFT